MTTDSKNLTTAPSGGFVWHDLLTREIDGSREFYEELFGWRVERSQTNDSHVVLSTTEEIVAGLLPLGDNDELLNRWIAYVGVDDVTEPPARALPLGGEAPLRDQLASRPGRISIVTDPHGASIAAIDGVFPVPEEGAAPPPHGTFCWHEIVTSEPEEAKTFYSKVFDWRVTCVPQGDLGVYWMLVNDSIGVAGVRPAPPLPGQRSFWLCYIAVRDVDETALRAEQLGGRVLTEPLDVHKFGRFATVSDRLGGVFAVLTNKRK
jgi:predicted enzyme related to lactoylglutathione lyase